MSDVYIMPSVSEPFGISPLEAMQSNVPVIISKQSGVAEILTHAVKTDFWDIDAMADAIYGILNYPALANMFIKNGKEEVIRLKWDNSAKHVRDIYSRVIGINKIKDMSASGKKAICFYFQVHQPFRLKRYRFFDLGHDHYYYDDYSNESIMRKVADKSYIPANNMMLDLIQKHKGKFKVSFSHFRSGY